jgi:hypothetical protein
VLNKTVPFSPPLCDSAGFVFNHQEIPLTAIHRHRGGADVNAKNSAGVTAQMNLAFKAESDEVSEALEAGADAFLKDTLGRLALDYLRLAHCQKAQSEIGTPSRRDTNATTWTKKTFRESRPY